MEMFHFTARGANFSKVKSFFEIIFTLVGDLFVCEWIQDGMLPDFFVWDLKMVRNIYRNKHAVAGRRLLVRLFLKFSGFSECMWHILKTLRRFGRHISFVWIDSNLLQQVSVAVVHISDR